MFKQETLIPEGSLVYDCRSFPDPQGRGVGKNGLDPVVRAWVMRDMDAASTVLEAGNAIKESIKLGDEDINVYFGCVGGMNRSVSLAMQLRQELAMDGIEGETIHLALPIWEKFKD